MLPKRYMEEYLRRHSQPCKELHLCVSITESVRGLFLEFLVLPCGELTLVSLEREQ
jgi:hypothetical protein